MSNPRIKSVIQAFRTHFQSEQVNVPLALRQESPDVIFTSLLEDDARPVAPPLPALGMGGGMDAMGGMPMGMEDPMPMAQELLSASVASAGPGPQPGPPPPAPGAQAAPGGAMPDIEALLGMM